MKPCPPLIAERKGILSLDALSELQKFWADAKENEAARNLREWVSPLIQRKAFRSLWCKEDAYREWETDIPITASSFLSYPEMGLTLHTSTCISAVTTLAGDHTSLGAIQCQDVEIRAFGPQSYPLSESSGFGIYRLARKEPMDFWTACAAFPDIWMGVESHFEPDLYRLCLKWIGLSQEKRLHFVFYVKAKEAQIEDQIFYPRELRRFKKEAFFACFNNQLKIQIDSPCPVELIPLAGGSCFWGCDFLLAFEMLPSENQKISFLISPGLPDCHG